MTRLVWVLRLGIAGEFVGHGWVGTGRPAAWLPFFQVFGFSGEFANAIMPVIGAWDIGVGLLMLVLPMRWLLIWTAVWGLFTAFLRPLAGQGWWEFLERAGNYGVPLALLLLADVHAYTRSVWSWLQPMTLRPGVSAAQAHRLAWVLRLSVATLLIGHGGIGAFMQPHAWMGYLAVLGIHATTVANGSLIATVGWAEIALGAVVLMRPFRGLLLFVVAWKVLTELLRPLAGEEIGQFIERSGSYAAPLTFALLVTSLRRATSGESGSDSCKWTSRRGDGAVRTRWVEIVMTEGTTRLLSSNLLLGPVRGTRAATHPSIRSVPRAPSRLLVLAAALLVLRSHFGAL